MQTINGTSGKLKWLGWFVASNLFWLVLAALALWLGWRSYTLSVDGEVATGTVVRLLEEDPSSFTTDIYPIVEFQVNGQSYSVQSQNNYRWWNRYTRFPIGKQVEMRYDPANPEKAEINSWIDLWQEPLILGVFTMIAALLTNLFLFSRWPRQPTTG